jgi:hypothetical protein
MTWGTRRGGESSAGLLAGAEDGDGVPLAVPVSMGFD